MHEAALLAPGVGEYLPAGHDSHEATLVAALDVENFPGKH